MRSKPKTNEKKNESDPVSFFLFSPQFVLFHAVFQKIFYAHTHTCTDALIILTQQRLQGLAPSEPPGELQGRLPIIERGPRRLVRPVGQQQLGRLDCVVLDHAAIRGALNHLVQGRQARPGAGCVGRPGAGGQELAALRAGRVCVCVCVE